MCGTLLFFEISPEGEQRVLFTERNSEDSDIT